eukprot:g4163.t1
MESVGKTPQCVERELGEILTARNAAISNAEDVRGIGPPDLCWLQRTAKGLFRKNKPKTQGYYHWVVGLNVTSPAAIAAYFARLTSGVKKVGYYQGMGVAREFGIERGIYCCYDPFSETDVWVDLALPGGSVTRCLDREGYLHEVETEMWQGTQLGSFLRSQHYDVSVTLHCSRCFQHLSPLMTHSDETELLDAVVELYRRNEIQSKLRKLHWDSGQGSEPYHLDVVCATILDYFKSRRRWQKALQFFTRLQSVYPSSVVYTAYVYQELDNEEGAAEVLRDALNELNGNSIDHPILTLAAGGIDLQHQSYQKASQAALSVLDTNPENRPAWFLLSRAYLSEGKYSQSLRALNLAPPPLIPADRRSLLLRVLPPKPRLVTKTFSFFHPEETELDTMHSEANKVGKMMNVVPGQILAPRVYLHGSDWGPLTSTQSVMRAAYDVLLDMVQLVGWGEFCKVRSSVFVIPDDEDNNISLENEVNRTPIALDWSVHETDQNPVHLKLHCVESVPWEKPRRKTEATYVRSISIPGQASLDLEKSNEDLKLECKTQVASNVLIQGLAQVTRTSPKTEQMTPSLSPDVKDDDEEETGSLKSSFETCSEFSLPSRTGEINIDVDFMNSPNVVDPGRGLFGRQRTEVITSAHLERLPSVQVPDAPENTLPSQCPPFVPSSSQGPSSSTSQDQWQVKLVSMGIQDRVQYFEKVAKEKSERQGKLQIPSKLEEDTTVSWLMPRRARYSVTHTIMEVLIKETPDSDLLMKTEEELEGDQESPDPIERQASAAEPDWGSFSLEEISFLPRKLSNGGEQTGSGQWCGASLVQDSGTGLVQLMVTGSNPCDCAPWLDELTLALWEDLVQYTNFKNLDRKLKSRNMQTHAEQILGTIEYNTDTTEEDEKTPKAPVTIPESHPVDWMRRGLLCQRLRKTPDAEQAFRVASFLSFSLTSLLALSQIYSDWGYCKGAMIILNRIAHFHHKKHDSRKESYIPMSLVKYLSMLMESVGKKDVTNAAEKCHPLLNLVLENVLKWKLQSGSVE